MTVFLAVVAGDWFALTQDWHFNFRKKFLNVSFLKHKHMQAHESTLAIIIPIIRTMWDP